MYVNKLISVHVYIPWYLKCLCPFQTHRIYIYICTCACTYQALESQLQDEDADLTDDESETCKKKIPSIKLNNLQKILFRVCVVNPCCVFRMCVLFYFYFVCLHVCTYAFNDISTYTLRALLQGPLREYHRARRFRASLLLHTTCVRSCCNWRASCVAAKQWKKKSWTTEPLST